MTIKVCESVDEESNIVLFGKTKSSSRYPVKLMKSELIEQAAEIVKDPQVLINVVSQRVKQLNTGRSPLIEVLPSMGAADVALTEIIEGKIKVHEAKLD